MIGWYAYFQTIESILKLAGFNLYEPGTQNFQTIESILKLPTTTISLITIP